MGPRVICGYIVDDGKVVAGDPAYTSLGLVVDNLLRCIGITISHYKG